MFEIKNCYKIIFEAMLETSVLGSIAEGIDQYTDTGVAFVSGTGRILAYSGLWSNLFPISVKKKHLILEDYEIIFEKEEISDRYLCVTTVYSGRIVVGYVVLVYEKEEKEIVQELGTILAQNVKRYFEEEQRQYVLTQSLREHMIGWTLFEDDASKRTGEKNCPEERYIAALLCKKGGRIEETIARLRNIWGCMYLYEEKEEVFLLLYRLTNRDVPNIYEKIKAEKIKCCISEVFSKIYLCKSRKNILKRMSLAGESRTIAVMRREKEWSMQGLYTYTASLIGRAGLSDYSVDRLLLEDEKNHTELYHTLKTYLLCENNVTVAAKALHIHRNTLVYRLKQIKECLETDVNDHEISRELLAFIMMNDASGQGIRSKTDYEDCTGTAGSIS